MKSLRFQLKVLVLVNLLTFLGCSSRDARSRYLLAEEIWDHGDYEAALVEFQRIYRKEEKTDLGRRSLQRAAEIQERDLKKYPESIESYIKLLEKNKSRELSRTYYLRIAEIYYSKLEDYPSSGVWYQKFIETFPKDLELPWAQLRYGKSLARSQRRSEAFQMFKEIQKKFPESSYSKEAEYEELVLESSLVRRELFSLEDTYQSKLKELSERMKSYKDRYQSDSRAAQIDYERAGIEEERGQYQEAQELYQSLSKNEEFGEMVRLKLERLKQRKYQKNL